MLPLIWEWLPVIIKKGRRWWVGGDCEGLSVMGWRWFDTDPDLGGETFHYFYWIQALYLCIAKSILLPADSDMFEHFIKMDQHL